MRWLFLAAVLAAAASHAQQWPERHVTVVTGYPAGSGGDLIARFVADGLRTRTGQAFVVDARPGANGNIAAQAVARAAPDGYTLLFTANSTHGINPSVFRQLGYDPVRDFSPVTTVLTSQSVLVVHASLPVKSLAELVAWLKARPGQAAYASNSASSLIAAELFRSTAGFEALHVPYKSGAAALADVASGQVQLLFADTTIGLAMARSGKVRALAVTGARRLGAAPELPTMMEAGVAGYDLRGWMGVFLPAGAPPAVARRLAELCNQLMASAEGREFLARVAADPFPGSPEQLAALVAAEIPRWRALAALAGIEPQ